MKKISKFKVENPILITLIIFAIISVTTIYSTNSYLSSYYQNNWIRQILWYIVGFVLSYSLMFIGNKTIYNNYKFLYIGGIISLVLVLFFGKTVNSARCWFELGPLNLQPSEFMKVILIITLSNIVKDFNERFSNPEVMDEFKLIMKCIVLTFIPAVLTFIEPDTGAVIFYLVSLIVILFVSGIRKRWFTILFVTLGVMGGIFFLVYFFKQDLFIKVLGTNFFYRIDRILNWSSGSGTQLNNSLIAIGSAGLFGHGFNNIPLYFPELHTDFIFASFTSMYGLIGASILIIMIIYFDINLIITGKNTYDDTNKYVMAGIVGILLYQQIQNIGMTIGLLPITGITLPFISYGGSSLLSYMILVGLIFNISNESLRFTNK